MFVFFPNNHHKISKKDLNFKVRLEEWRHFQNECLQCQVKVELNLGSNFGIVSLGWLLRISTIIHQQGFQLWCNGVGEENVVPIVPLVLEKHLSLSFWTPALVMRYKMMLSCWESHYLFVNICVTMGYAHASSKVNNLLGKFT